MTEENNNNIGKKVLPVSIETEIQAYLDYAMSVILE